MQQSLAQPQAAEFLYETRLVPTPVYTFKHALTRQAAYQSLRLSTRQQLHEQIAQVLETQFAAMAETQPERLAHHYTEAGLGAQALVYWQRAGQRALARSANQEAARHLTTGLALLATLPDTPERTQDELAFHLALGTSLMATKSYAASETGDAYRSALALSQQVGDPGQHFAALRGVWQFHLLRGELGPARVLGEQLFRQAQEHHDEALLIEAHRALGSTLYWRGELREARAHFEQSLALYDPQQHRTHTFRDGLDPGVVCLTNLALALWGLGYPDQASQRSQAGIALAREVAHPVSLTFALTFTAVLHQFRRESHRTQHWTEGTIALAAEQGFIQWLQMDTFLRGWALTEPGDVEAGIAQMRQGMTGWWAMGADLHRPYFLALLAEAYGKVGQADAGLGVLGEACEAMRHHDERLKEAEVYRLRSALLLQGAASASTHRVTLAHAPAPDAEASLHTALAVARQQHAKSLELRAAMGLARLWQRQGKVTEARTLLAPVYGWFTEGFDTADLQDARALLEALG